MEIGERFEYKEFNVDQQCTSSLFRGGFTALAGNIEGLLRDGRYKSLALTALEEAAMWVNKSIAFDTDEVHVRGVRT